MQQDYDAEHDRIIQSRGLYVLRISNDDIHNNLFNTISRIGKNLPETCGTAEAKIGKGFGLRHPLREPAS